MNDSSSRRRIRTARGARSNRAVKDVRNARVEQEAALQCQRRQALGALMLFCFLVAGMVLLYRDGPLSKLSLYYSDLLGAGAPTALMENSTGASISGKMIGGEEPPIIISTRSEDLTIEELPPLPSLFSSGSQWTRSNVLSNNQTFVWAPPGEAERLDDTTPGAWTKGSLNGEDSALLLKGSLHNTTLDTWFQSFRELSNYEIVCWFGKDVAQQHYEAFKSLRGDLFPKQRPFKFHYHRITHLRRVDENWDAEEKVKFRKCKQSLIVLDDVEIPEPMQELVIAFVKHIMVALPDPTFPIWIVTANNASISTVGQQLSSIGQRKLNNNQSHQQYRALYDIVQRRGELLGTVALERVRLLDYSDLLAVTPDGVRQVDIMSVVALRTYVILGKQVQQWRAAGQVGRVDGLHRGDTVEPNKRFKTRWLGDCKFRRYVPGSTNIIYDRPRIYCTNRLCIINSQSPRIHPPPESYLHPLPFELTRDQLTRHRRPRFLSLVVEECLPLCGVWTFACTSICKSTRKGTKKGKLALG